jgi:hypothetical protein
MLLSDIVGSLSGILLLAPPVRDQVLRYRALREARKGENSPAPNLRQVLRNAIDSRRNDFNGLDSLATGLGGLGIVACFGLKLLEL